MTPRERENLVIQIFKIVDQLFVHRRMKTALYGVDAAALLYHLATRAADMADADVHRAIRRIVTQIRDRHTRYSFAPGTQDYVLPFTIERAFDGSNPIYLITRSVSEWLPPGSRVVRWNGVPTEAVVRELAEDVAAGNDAARHALALVFLTRRLGTRFDPPREYEVRLDLVLPDGSTGEARVQWAPVPPLSSLQGAVARGAPWGQGVDTDLLSVRRDQFRTFSTRFAELDALAFGNVDLRVVRHADKDFAHLRIFDFNVDDADDFAGHVAGLLRSAPRSGVIIDLRGNPGGYIKAGELLLQLFTGGTIQPHGFRFRASDAVDFMIASSSNYSAWAATVQQGRRLGAEHSTTFPIEDDESAYNRIGRVYPGPSILVVDALAFSTANMFTAGFKDHGIGPVICTDENIAAGGANNWPYDVLRASLPAFLLAPEVDSDLDKGTIPGAVRDAFASNGHGLSAAATVRRLPPDRLGDLWEIADGSDTYLVGKREWLRRELAVYFDGGNRFVDDLPPGAELGFSIRQAVRRMQSDGLVLEDEGITADHYYRMTREDVLGGNAKLIEFACGLLEDS